MINDFFSSSNNVNITISIVFWSWGAVMVWRGALLGARAHSRPRLFVAVAMTAIVAAYVVDLAGWIGDTTRADRVRAAGWVLAVSLGFTALTGIKYGTRVKSVVEVLDKFSDDDAGE